MTSVLKFRTSGYAIAAVMGVLGSAPLAHAADLGGNCCADLEERIAELEATTARKGNRKVSLTISGYVNEAVFFWDDGQEQNVYVGTNSLEQSRFKLSGKAKIDGDWSAGYTLEIGVAGGVASQFSQLDDNGTSPNSVTVRKSVWYVDSKKLGRLSVGQDGTSTYHLLDDADGTNTRSFSDAEAAAVAMGAFRLVVNGTQQTVQWGQILGGFNNNTPGQGGRRNVVKYDTPVFAGFSVSASWGEDDMWDTALSYSGEVGDFKLVGKAGYGESSDNNDTGSCVGTFGTHCTWWGVAGTVMHKPTGLFVYGAYGEHTDDDIQAATVATAEDTNTMWYVQAGIERKFIPLGKTTIFGEYRQDDVGRPEANRTVAGLTVAEASVDFWAAGIVQTIDAAAMDIYLIYRHADGDVTSTTNVKTNLDDFDMLIAGAKINF
jgi:predicted porin